MKRAKQAWCRGIAVSGLLLIFVGSVVGEPQRKRGRFSPSGTGSAGFRFQPGTHIGGLWGGNLGRSFFFGARHRGFSPFSNDLALADSAPQERWFPGFLPYGGWSEPRIELSSRSDRFVSEWIAKEPVSGEPESTFSDLSQSLLLRQGMSEDKVVLAVGSPIMRTASRSSEIWKFSGFDLLFAEDRLQGIR